MEKDSYGMFYKEDFGTNLSKMGKEGTKKYTHYVNSFILIFSLHLCSVFKIQIPFCRVSILDEMKADFPVGGNLTKRNSSKRKKCNGSILLNLLEHWRHV